MNYKLNKSYRKFKFFINTIRNLTLFFKWYIDNSKFIQAVLKNDYRIDSYKFIIDGYKTYDEYEIFLYNRAYNIFKLTFDNLEGLNKYSFINFIRTNATLKHKDFFYMLLTNMRFYLLSRLTLCTRKDIVEKINNLDKNYYDIFNEKCIKISRELNKK